MFSVFAYPDIDTRGVGRIRDSYANPRRNVSVSLSEKKLTHFLCNDFLDVSWKYDVISDAYFVELA